MFTQISSIALCVEESCLSISNRSPPSKEIQTSIASLPGWSYCPETFPVAIYLPVLYKSAHTKKAYTKTD